MPAKHDVTIRRMQTQVTLKYDGLALVNGQMDVYQAAGNMVAFSEFMVAAVKETYGSAAEANAEVSGFAGGSFDTNLIFTVVGSAATIFSALTAEQLWEVVRGAFDLWKHLKGEPPKETAHSGDQFITVTNNDGQIINVRTESFHLVINQKASEAVERFVNLPLQAEGVDTVQIGEGKGKKKKAIATVKRDEAGYFKQVSATVPISDNTYRIVLNIVSPVFQDGNKWRFSDGGTAFNATIKDGDFLMKVDKGLERFGKGDAIEADVRAVQTKTGARVSIEREILKVHSHIRPHEQLPFKELED